MGGHDGRTAKNMRWRQWRKGKGMGKEKRRKKRMKSRRMVIAARLLV
jgi:hypothetical protein